MFSAKNPINEQKEDKNKKNQKYIADYLTLLGVEKCKPSLEYLHQLIEAHLYKIPFDSSSLTLHKPENYALKNREILTEFQKGRGAICFQANGAFKKLLILLGFEEATLASAKMLRYQSECYVATDIDAHCAILLAFKGNEYLIDVSWGNAFRGALRIGKEHYTDLPGEKTRQCLKEEGVYKLYVKIKDKWEVEYQFEKANKKTKEFAVNTRFLGTSPAADLYNKLLLIRRLPNGEVTYIDQSIYEGGNTLFCYYKSRNAGKTIKTSYKDKASAEKKLREFGVPDTNCKDILSNVFKTT